MKLKINQNHYDLFVLENILSTDQNYEFERIKMVYVSTPIRPTRIQAQGTNPTKQVAKKRTPKKDKSIFQSHQTCQQPSSVWK